MIISMRYGVSFKTRHSTSGQPERCPTVATSGGSDQRTFGPVTIPKGRLWVMGDHRGDSADSRFHCIEAAPAGSIAIFT